MQDMTNEAGTGEQDVSQLTTTVLAARLPAASPWMPRREMEELLRRGPDAAPPLIDVLRRAQGRGDPLWPIVVLGELHRDDAIPALGLFLGRMEGGVNVAAAEALGKIGAAALPYLVAMAAGEDRGRRLAAYGALAMIPTDEAHSRLKDALARDRALGDVIARALVQQGRPEAIAALAASAVHAPKWMRREFESAIAALVHGPVAPDPVERDWRLRYRRLPALGWNFPLTWLGVAALVHRARPRRARPRLAHALRRDHRHRRPPRGPPLPALRRRVLASGRAPRLPAHRRGHGRAPGRAPRPLARRRRHRRLGGARRLRRRRAANRTARRLRAAARPRRGGSRHPFLAGHHSLRRPPYRPAKTPPHQQ